MKNRKLRIRLLAWSAVLLLVLGVLPAGDATEQAASDWVEPIPPLAALVLTEDNADLSASVSWEGILLTDGDTVPADARLTAHVTVRPRVIPPRADYLTYPLPDAVQTGETGWTALPGGLRWRIAGREAVIDLRGASVQAMETIRFAFPFTLEASAVVAFPGSPIAMEVAEPKVRPLRYQGADFTVQLLPSESAGLPENAVLRVEERTDTAGFAARAMETVGVPEEKVRFFRVFDMAILSDGQEIEPKGPVRVTVTLADEADEIAALHFAEDAPAAEPARRGAKAVKAAPGADVLEATVGDTGISFETDHFSIYAFLGYTLKKTVVTGDGLTYEITMTFMDDAELPDDVALNVREYTAGEQAEYLGRAAVLMNAAGFAYGRVFDISLTDGAGAELQPGAPVQVSVSLLDAEDPEDPFSVVHFGEDTAEQVTASTEGNRVAFSAESFSAYAIVQGPESIPLGWSRITDVADLTAYEEGVYIGHTSGYYLMDTLTADSSRSGITKTKPAQSSPGIGAALYQFIPVEGTDNKFYIRCGEDKYVKNANNNSLSFTSAADATAFTVTVSGNGVFKVNNGQWYWNMQGGANGSRFCAWNSANDANNNLYIWHYQAVAGDPYGLSGTTCGLMSWTGGVAGKALMAEQSGSALKAMALTVMTQKDDQNDKLFVPNDSEISMWTFEWIDLDRYYLKSTVNGAEVYLQVNAGGLALVSEPDDACVLQVVPGTGTHAGEICLKSAGGTLTYTGDVNQGFSVGGAVGSEWLHMVDLSELTSDYFRIYTAAKVSVSDERVTNGSRIIVYARVWNDDTKKYEFYAVDHDGSLVRCYESGDEIQWVGGQFNTMLWNFVEYYNEGTTTPNYYYELYNEYGECFMAPQLTGGQTLAPREIGINLNGRRNGAFYTTVVAWDDPAYAYACLKTEIDDGAIVSIPFVNAAETPDAVDFGFAIVQDLSVDDQLTTVPTVDHEQHGITMRIVDIGTRKEMSDFLGNDDGGIGNVLHQGLLSTDLKGNGFPDAQGGSLASLYSGSRQVNHLFISSTYSGSGYFVYDSTQNYAVLDGSDFIVYNELGTHDGNSRNTLKHGQFFPFNAIRPGVFASVNGRNLYSATADPLPDNDPRKNERLYLIDKPDYYFAVDLEASFVQTPDGLDAWGHDIIYQFTGDDDFWLYVDGELVIDLGGIHSAVPGSVNYRTGAVSVNGVNTTLRDLFYSNYKGRGHTDAEAQAYVDDIFEQNSAGQWIFKANTTHTMRIFYMERGAGASNLYMRFNLASVKPGTVLLSKDLKGVDASESVLAEFAYQILYTLDDENSEVVTLHQDQDKPNVLYKDTTTPVDFRETYTVGGVTYEDVFILRPGETAVIDFNDLIIAGSADDVTYRIVECGVNTDVYEHVRANDTELTGTAVPGHDNRRDFGIEYASSKDRNRVAYENEVNPNALCDLTIDKKLFREDGETEITYDEDQTVFNFRLYFGTESQSELAPASMYTYHVKDRSGNYCRWDADGQCFVSLGKTDYNDLTPAEKTAASFSTSMYGTISKIPATYRVELRQVLAGTQYRVEERPWEIPDGYSFQKYNKDDTAAIVDLNGTSGVQDTLTAGRDTHVDVCNLRGYGLRVNKVWSDADYMTDREPTYFAVFAERPDGSLTMVDGSVRQMTYRQNTRYWYYLTLPVSDVPFDHYRIREVTLSAASPTVDDDGVVMNYGTVTVIGDYGEVQLTGRQTGEAADGSFTYTVVYDEGFLDPESNVRVDTVTNGRPGVALRKADWDWNALQGASFELKDDEGHTVGTFVSDANGLITLAFLRDNVTYTLAETGAPKGYHGLEGSLTIRLTEDGPVIGGVDASVYRLSEEGGITTLTIRDRTASLQVLKVDGATSQPIPGIHFALHRQVTVGGVTDFDINPMAGFEDMVSNADGVLEELTLQNLSAGTYQLREKQPADGCKTLPEHLRFTIGAGGTVTILNASYHSWLTETVTDGDVVYVLAVPNDPLDPVTVTVSGVKVLTGRRMRKGEFTFLLTPIDISGTPTDEPARTVCEAAAAGEDSPFSFNPVTFTYTDWKDAPYRDGNGNAWFYYEVREAVSDAVDENGYEAASMIRYDTGRYLVVIRVYVEDGALHAVMECHEYDGGPVPAQYQPPAGTATA